LQRVYDVILDMIDKKDNHDLWSRPTF
jgi:hypothetical protein